MRLSHVTLVFILLIAALSASCGGSGGAGRGPITSGAAPVLSGVEFSAGKGTSGLPTGVRVTWPRVASVLAVGYYLYRDTQSITAADPLLRVNGGNLILQQATSPIVFQDEFNPVIGQTYYYRLSVVDIYDEESDLSNELSLTIQPHVVAGLNPEMGYYGDTVTITGTDFGVYSPADDFIYFMTDNMGRLEAAIVDWNSTSVECVVPQGAITAPVQMEVAGTVSESDIPFEILNPFLINVDPAYAVSGEQITLTGDNLTDTPATGDGVTMPGGVFLPYDSPYISSWADGAITLTVPPVIGPEGDITASVGGEVTNGVFFSVRPSITNCTPRRLVRGALTDVTISGFNFGDGSNGSLYIVDLSGTNPAPPVVVTSGRIVSWTNYNIVFRTPDATYGALPALIVRRGAFDSDPFAVGMLPPLASEFLFPVPDTTIMTPTIFAVKSVQDMEKVEFYLNSLDTPIAIDTVGPAFEITIDPALLFNGTYILYAKAFRGAEVALGNIRFDVLSLRGDTNCDGFVDDRDIVKISENLGVLAGNILYHRYLDPNLDGIIDERDVAYIGYYFNGIYGTT